ncbi:hypothetical protein QQG55_10780 [Brugia pahangi]
MLGLVNLPSECVDFYAQPKNIHNSFTFFGQCKNKPTVSYRNDGRRIIDGKLEMKKEPHEMWNNLLINLLIKSISTKHSDEINEKMYEQQLNDSSKISSINNDTTMKSILPQNSKSTMQTTMSNINSKNSNKRNKYGK